jgi:energy-coupling factor transport system permease protein
VLTGDKFTSLFGNFIPSISLLLVMVFRLIPNFIRKVKQIIAARKAIGKGAGEKSTAKEKLTDGMTVLGALTGWALEDSVITGDSMRARGYGTAKRTSFMIYRMTGANLLILAVMLVLLTMTVTAALLGQTVAKFVPAVQLAPAGWGIAAYSVYLLIPTVLHIKEAFAWRISRSKI